MNKTKVDNKIKNDAPLYGLKTPPCLNKWGFTHNADLDNPPINITAVRASIEYYILSVF